MFDQLCLLVNSYTPTGELPAIIGQKAAVAGLILGMLLFFHRGANSRRKNSRES